MVGADDALRRADALVPRMAALLDVYHDMFGTHHIGVIAVSSSRWIWRPLS